MAVVSVPILSASAHARQGAQAHRSASSSRDARPGGRSRMRLALALALLAWLVVFACAVLGGSGGGGVGGSGTALVSARTHTVAAGETLWSIARSADGGSADPRAVVAAIVARNQLSGTAIHAGQVLVLP